MLRTAIAGLCITAGLLMMGSDSDPSVPCELDLIVRLVGLMLFCAPLLIAHYDRTGGSRHNPTYSLCVRGRSDHPPSDTPNGRA